MATLLSTTVVLPLKDLPPEIALCRVVDEATAAQILAVSPSTLERMRKRGTAPKHLMLSPRRLGYRVSDLISWVEQRSAASEAA